MSIPVETTIGLADPTIKFTTVNGLITLLNALIQSEIDEDISTFIFGKTTPTVENQDKPWIRLDSVGRPMGVYVYYSGLWVPQGPDPGSYIGIYAGNPAVDFDGTGKGLAGPGPVALPFWGWQLMNGQNGVANLSDRFIIGAKMDNLASGYSGGWRSTVEGSAHVSGGAATKTLTEDTTYRPARGAVTASKYTATGAAVDAGGSLYGTPSGGSVDLLAADAGNTSPDPVSVVNPYYAFAFIQWVGYP